MVKRRSRSSRAAPLDERQRLLAAIVQEAGGKLVGKTILFKAYWVAHLYYWRDHRGSLTRHHGLVHMPNGPGVAHHEILLSELAGGGADRWITISTRSRGPFPQTVFRTKKPIEVDAATRDAIRKALKFVGGLDAAAASKLAHDVSRSWQRAESGEELDIYLDRLTDEEFEDNQRRLDLARAKLRDVF